MHKNWKAIYDIPDAHFRWALALLDTETDFGQRIIELLPDYFTEEEQTEQYPLSFLRDQACIDAKRVCS